MPGFRITTLSVFTWCIFVHLFILKVSEFVLQIVLNLLNSQCETTDMVTIFSLTVFFLSYSFYKSHFAPKFIWFMCFERFVCLSQWSAFFSSVVIFFFCLYCVFSPIVSSLSVFSIKWYSASQKIYYSILHMFSSFLLQFFPLNLELTTLPRWSWTSPPSTSIYWVLG